MAGEFATDFDGSSDYYNRGSDLTGNADSKKGILSTWLRFDASDGENHFILTTDNSSIRLLKGPDNKLAFLARSTVPDTVISAFSTSTYTASASWLHVICSWDLSVPVFRLYVDDADDEAGGSTEVDTAIDYTRPSWGFGSATDGTLSIDGAISEFYFNTAEYIDLSIEANRRKFISTSGKPVPLGVAGELPTTNQPIIYCPDGDATVNKGSGGVFVKNGAPVRIAGPGDKPSPAAKIYEVLRGS